MGQYSTSYIHVKMQWGNLSSTQNTPSVCLNSIYHAMALIMNCDKITNSDVRVARFVAIFYCRNLWGFETQLFRLVSKCRGYTDEYLEHTSTLSMDPLQKGFLNTSCLIIISHIHTHIHLHHSYNTITDRISTSHIHVKSVQGFPPMCTEHIFNMIEI